LASSRRFVIKNVPVDKIIVPKIRVTSYYDPEMAELLRDSVQTVGIMQPLLVAEDGENYVLIDGYNRLQQAKIANLKTVPCAVIQGDLKTVLLQNLGLNYMRGKVRPTEMLQVVAYLSENYGLDIDQISAQSGLRRDLVEKLLAISRCDPAVVSALDAGEISLTHAHEISRLPDPEAQKRLLNQVLIYKINTKDLREIVNETLQLLQQKQQKQQQQQTTESEPQPVKIPTIKCHLCEQEWPVRKVAGFNLCMQCYAIAQQAVQQHLQQLIQAAAEARQKQLQQIQQITGGEGG